MIFCFSVDAFDLKLIVHVHLAKVTEFILFCNFIELQSIFLLSGFSLSLFLFI